MSQTQTQAEPAQLSPERTRAVSDLARALMAAARHWALYPSEHPTVVASVDRLVTAARQAVGERGLQLGVTPDALIVDGVVLSEGERAIADAAALLHDRDILQLGFTEDVASSALRSLLKLLSLDSETLRSRGGPAAIWADTGDRSITLEQIDYRRVLEDSVAPVAAAKKNDLWRLIIQSITERRKSLDEASQQRLLEIAGDAGAIADLAKEVMAPGRTPDGSPLLSTQAAAVLAAYRQLTSIVSVLAPERRDEVMRNLVEATTTLDPAVTMEMMKDGDDGGPGSGGESNIVQDLAKAFDDEKVAQLLATTLAMQGYASQRLATVFSTLAPNEDRRGRILTMTRSVLNAQLFGQEEQFGALWGSMEELLVSHNDQRYMGARYRANLDHVGDRAESMATLDAPEELDEWVKTLGQESVRRLSVTLLIDLLRMEQEEVRASEMVEEIGSLAEDLLIAGDYDAAVRVARVLSRRANRESAVASASSKRMLTHLARSAALGEAVASLGEMDDAPFTAFRPLCPLLGATTVPALLAPLMVEEEARALARATEIIVAFKGEAVAGIAQLATHAEWFARVRAADMLGSIGVADGVRLLQPMLRNDDVRVLQAALRALSHITDPAAARAIQMVLRTASGAQRKAVVDALVALRDRRVVPLLVQILNESNPLGADHVLVLETLGGLEVVADERAMPALIALMQRRSWFRRARMRALKHATVAVLERIGTQKSKAALQTAAAPGGWRLRRFARTAASG